MEMWCLYDIGRDSWDWVGPPAWGRACFNSPEWGGSYSPVITEPLQIVLLLLCVACCVVWHAENSRVYMQNVPVCTCTTPACGAGTHGDVLNVHTEGVLNVHTGRGVEEERRREGSA